MRGFRAHRSFNRNRPPAFLGSIPGSPADVRVLLIAKPSVAIEDAVWKDPAPINRMLSNVELILRREVTEIRRLGRAQAFIQAGLAVVMPNFIHRVFSSFIAAYSFSMSLQML